MPYSASQTPVSSALDSTSETTAASSLAIKTVHDDLQNEKAGTGAVALKSELPDVPTTNITHLNSVIAELEVPQNELEDMQSAQWGAVASDYAVILQAANGQFAATDTILVKGVLKLINIGSSMSADWHGAWLCVNSGTENYASTHFMTLFFREYADIYTSVSAHFQAVLVAGKCIATNMAFEPAGETNLTTQVPESNAQRQMLMDLTHSQIIPITSNFNIGIEMLIDEAYIGHETRIELIAHAYKLSGD